MTQESLDRARASFVDSYNRPANYASLCERVNALGTALADLKAQLAVYQQDKQELCKMITKLRTLQPAELQKTISQRFAECDSATLSMVFPQRYFRQPFYQAEGEGDGHFEDTNVLPIAAVKESVLESGLEAEVMAMEWLSSDESLASVNDAESSETNTDDSALSSTTDFESALSDAFTCSSIFSAHDSASSDTATYDSALSESSPETGTCKFFKSLMALGAAAVVAYWLLCPEARPVVVQPACAAVEKQFPVLPEIQTYFAGVLERLADPSLGAMPDASNNLPSSPKIVQLVRHEPWPLIHKIDDELGSMSRSFSVKIAQEELVNEDFWHAAIRDWKTENSVLSREIEVLERQLRDMADASRPVVPEVQESPLPELADLLLLFQESLAKGFRILGEQDRMLARIEQEARAAGLMRTKVNAVNIPNCSEALVRTPLLFRPIQPSCSRGLQDSLAQLRDEDATLRRDIEASYKRLVLRLMDYEATCSQSKALFPSDIYSMAKERLNMTDKKIDYVGQLADIMGDVAAGADYRDCEDTSEQLDAVLGKLAAFDTESRFQASQTVLLKQTRVNGILTRWKAWLNILTIGLTRSDVHYRIPFLKETVRFHDEDMRLVELKQQPPLARDLRNVRYDDKGRPLRLGKLLVLDIIVQYWRHVEDGPFSLKALFSEELMRKRALSLLIPDKQYVRGGDDSIPLVLAFDEATVFFTDWLRRVPKDRSKLRGLIREAARHVITCRCCRNARENVKVFYKLCPE